MLNCCIERKVARESTSTSPLPSTSNMAASDEDEPMEQDDQCDAPVAPSTDVNIKPDESSLHDNSIATTTKYSDDDNTTETSDDDEFYECIESESQTNISQSTTTEASNVKKSDSDEKLTVDSSEQSGNDSSHAI